MHVHVKAQTKPLSGRISKGNCGIILDVLGTILENYLFYFRDDLREHLKNAPRKTQSKVQFSSSSSSESSSDSSDDEGIICES